MQVFTKDIQAVLAPYESAQWLPDLILKKEDFALIKELRLFNTNLPKNSEHPLSPVELYELCKILINNNQGLNSTAHAITQLRTKLGIAFECLELLDKNGLYNWYYFDIVYNCNKHQYVQLKKCLSDKNFCTAIDSLAREQILTNDILWLIMTWNSYGFEILNDILSALDKYKILNVAFFPLLINHDCHYSSTIVYKRLIQRVTGLTDLIPYENIFSRLVQRIVHLPSKTFSEFHQAVHSYRSSHKKLSYAGNNEASTDDVRELCETLFTHDILTLKRFKFILSKPKFMVYIDGFLNLAIDPISKLENKETYVLIKKYFDALLNFIEKEILAHPIKHFQYPPNRDNFEAWLKQVIDKEIHKEDIITKVNIITLLRPQRNSFFSLLPLEVLKLVAASSQYTAYRPYEAEEIVQSHIEPPKP